MFIEQLLCDGHSLRAEDKSVTRQMGPLPCQEDSGEPASWVSLDLGGLRKPSGFLLFSRV